MSNYSVTNKTEGRIRWGIMGCAKIAEMLFNQAVKDSSTGELYAIASRDEHRAQEWKNRFGFRKAYGSYRALLEDEDVNTVYIALPNHLHSEWAIEAARSGKNILCEKPAAMNVQETVAIVDAAVRNKVLFTENFAFRFHPRTTQIRKLIDEGVIGQVKSLLVSLHNVTPRSRAEIRYQREAGGGAAMDLGSYTVAFSRFIFGKEPMFVVAHQSIDAEFGVDISFNGILDFGDGGTATFATGFQNPGWQAARILGSDGEIFVRTPFHPRVPNDVTVLKRERMQAAGTVRIDEEESIKAPIIEPFLCVAENIGRVLRGEADLLLPGKESIANMRALEACVTSAIEGRRISLEPNLFMQP